MVCQGIKPFFATPVLAYAVARGQAHVVHTETEEARRRRSGQKFLSMAAHSKKGGLRRSASSSDVVQVEPVRVFLLPQPQLT